MFSNQNCEEWDVSYDRGGNIVFYPHEEIIRFADKSDTDRIMRFIGEYWRKGHILSRDRKLFEWQYGGEGDRLNIVIGLDERDEMQGMLGFVPYDRTDNKDIALALWKANPDTGFLGIRLIDFLMKNEPHREIVCPGINLETTSKIYEYFGMEIGTMTQWYRLAPNRDYRIARIVDDSIPDVDEECIGRSFKQIRDIEEFTRAFDLNANSYQASVPFKSVSYIDKRYFRHPAYTYKLYEILERDEKSDSVLVFRVQECNESRALRLIDVIGNAEGISSSTGMIDSLMDEYDCEYVDFYECGMDETILRRSGWRKVEREGNVIPDYFSPYECRKVDIHYSTSCPAAVLCKGDGDQDRPN